MTKFQVGDMVVRHPARINGGWERSYGVDSGNAMVITKTQYGGRIVEFDGGFSWHASHFIFVKMENE